MSDQPDIILVYSEHDQELIDAAHRCLKEYEESLSRRLKREYSSEPDSNQKIMTEFFTDLTRCALLENLIKLLRTVIPERMMVQ